MARVLPLAEHGLASSRILYDLHAPSQSSELRLLPHFPTAPSLQGSPGFLKAGERALQLGADHTLFGPVFLLKKRLLGISMARTSFAGIPLTPRDNVLCGVLCGDPGCGLRCEPSGLGSSIPSNKFTCDRVPPQPQSSHQPNRYK